MAKAFTLVITGAEGARYTGRCTLTTAAGAIEAVGRITVEIAHGGSVSRAVTSGGTVNIAVR